MYHLPVLFLTLAISAACIVAAGEPNLKLTGNFMQGGLVHGQVVPGEKVQINGHGVRVSVDGKFIIGFGRDYPAQAKLMVFSVDGSTKRNQTLNIEAREYAIERIDGLMLHSTWDALVVIWNLELATIVSTCEVVSFLSSAIKPSLPQRSTI